MLHAQIKTMLADKLAKDQSADFGGFAQSEAMYAAKFLMGETITADQLGKSQLDYMGFTLDQPDFSVFDEISPCEFDSSEEYYSFIKTEKARMQSLKVISPDTVFACICNYKGEEELPMIQENAKCLPVFVSKDHSFSQF